METASNEVKVVTEVNLIDVDGDEDLCISIIQPPVEGYLVVVKTLSTGKQELAYACQGLKKAQLCFGIRLGELCTMGYRLSGEAQGVAALQARAALSLAQDKSERNGAMKPNKGISLLD